jgi:hypothetical protein
MEGGFMINLIENKKHNQTILKIVRTREEERE